MNKKIIGILICTLMIASGFGSGASIVLNHGDHDLNENNGEHYKVRINPVGAESSDDCCISYNITKEEAERLRDNVFNCQSYNSTSEYIQSNMDLIKDMGIITDELYSNITNYVSQQKMPLGQTDPFIPKVRFGPSLYFYASVMSQYTFINDVSNNVVIFGNMTRLSTIMEKFVNMSNPLYKFAYNVTVSYYTMFTTWQIGIGGSISLFASFGPLPNQNYYFYGPFLGVFIFPITLLGIYIYAEVDTDFPGGSYELPFLDIMISMPLVFSLVIPGWYVEPDNLD